MTSPRRVFISGVAGFLGSHLAEALVRRGHHVSGCDSLRHGGDPANVPAGVEFHVQDARDPGAMTRLLHKTDIVFHAAALGHDGFSVSAPHVICENIFSSTSSLLSAAARGGVRRFVYCSSMARYGDQYGLFTEDLPCAPVTPYGVAKVAGEQLVRNICAANGMEWVICVPHNIIGPRQRYDDPYRNVAAIMINRLLQDLPAVIYGDGSQRRCFSSIHDMMTVLEPLLFDPRASGEVINCGPDEEFVSLNELFQQVSAVLGKDIPPRYEPARPLEVKDANCSADKARRLFGYRTGHRLRESLEEMAAWITARGPKPFDYSLPLEIVNERTPATWRDRSL